MSYFSYIPNTTYIFDGKTVIVKDICKRSRFISEYKPYSDLYDEYTITDSDTLESLALRFYNSAKYHWVIALFNELHDLDSEFPLNQVAFDNYVNKKYEYVDEDNLPQTNLYKTKYYVDSNQTIVGEIKEYKYSAEYSAPGNPGVDDNQEYTPVTFYEYENSLNEAKRKIYILRPELLSEFVTQFERSMNV